MIEMRHVMLLHVAEMLMLQPCKTDVHILHIMKNVLALLGIDTDEIWCLLVCAELVKRPLRASQRRGSKRTSRGSASTRGP